MTGKGTFIDLAIYIFFMYTAIVSIFDVVLTKFLLVIKVDLENVKLISYNIIVALMYQSQIEVIVYLGILIL